MTRWDHFKDKLGYVWWGFVCALQALLGPICIGCRRTSWSERSARRHGWQYGTYYDGNADWLCKGCVAADAETREW